MTFDLSLMTALVALALTTLNLFIGIRSLLSEGTKKLDIRVKTAEESIGAQGLRLQAIESDMRHMPDNDTVTKLQIDMADLKGQIASIAKTSEATERATRRVEEFLLREKS